MEINAMITRREFAMSSAAVLALGALGSLGGPAFAQTISGLELMAKGALDDIAMGWPRASKGGHSSRRRSNIN